MKACPICKNQNNKIERVLNNIDLLKCSNCNFVFASVSDEYAEAANAKHGDALSSVYELQQTTFDKVWFSRIAQRFTKRLRGGKVLDVGCGNGLLLKHFKSFNWDCYGLDLSPWSKEYSKEYGFTLYQGKVEDLNIEENTFDLVVSTSTLEHILHPLLHIEKIIKLIKPGGFGFFTGIPNYASISIALGLSRFDCNTPPGHVNYFTPKTITRLFDLVNTPIKWKTIKTYGVPETQRLYRQINFKICRVKNMLQGHDASKKKLGNKKQGKYINKLLGELFVNLYYYPGRAFLLGDKLEITVAK